MGFYRGVTAHHSASPVRSFDDAVRVQRSGSVRSKVASVYEREHDGSIAFRLYATDVVVWHPDNSFEVENYGTATTSSFAARFTPAYVHLHHPKVTRDHEGGHKLNSFRMGAVETPCAILGDTFMRGTYHVCQGDVVRFIEKGEFWVPDETTCDDIKLPTGLNRKAARAVAKQYHFAEFESWLTVAPTTLGNVEHDAWDLLSCMGGLETRDWRSVAEHLPLIKTPRGFGTAERMKPLPIATGHWEENITMGSFAKLKLAIWDYENLLDTETRKTWERKEYERGMARVREMATLGLNVYDLGPS